MSVTQLRPAGLTASRVADAIGVGWASPIRLWGELRGLEGFDPPAETEAMRIGRAMQPVIFSELVHAGYLGAMFPHDPPEIVWTDAERSWLTGHPDGIANGSSWDALYVVEAKAQGHAHPDLSALIQLQTYIHLGGYEAGLLATLRGLHLDVVEVERDDRQIGLILYLAERFMDHVRSGELPPILGHPDDRHALEAIEARYPAAPHKVAETRAMREWRRELAALRAADGKAGARARRKVFLEASYVAGWNGATEAVGVDGETVATWKEVVSHRFDTRRHEAEHPRCHKQYVTESRGRRLTLK